MLHVESMMLHHVQEFILMVGCILYSVFLIRLGLNASYLGIIYIQRFRVKCGLLGSEAGKGWPQDLGRMSANDAKTV